MRKKSPCSIAVWEAAPREDDDDMDHGSNDIDHIAAGLDSLEEADDADQPGDAQPQEYLAGQVHKLREARGALSWSAT